MLASRKQTISIESRRRSTRRRRRYCSASRRCYARVETCVIAVVNNLFRPAPIVIDETFEDPLAPAVRAPARAPERRRSRRPRGVGTPRRCEISTRLIAAHSARRSTSINLTDETAATRSSTVNVAPIMMVSRTSLQRHAQLQPRSPITPPSILSTMRICADRRRRYRCESAAAAAISAAVKTRRRQQNPAPAQRRRRGIRPANAGQRDESTPCTGRKVMRPDPIRTRVIQRGNQRLDPPDVRTITTVHSGVSTSIPHRAGASFQRSLPTAQMEQTSSTFAAGNIVDRDQRQRLGIGRTNIIPPLLRLSVVDSVIFIVDDPHVRRAHRTIGTVASAST